MTYPVPQNTYVVASGTSSTGPFITVLMDRVPGAHDTNYLVGQRWVNTANNNAEYMLIGFTASGGVVTANWVLLNPGSGPITVLAGNDSINVGPNGSGVIHVLGDSSGIQFAGNAGTNTLTASLANIPNSSLAHSSITVAAGANITVTGSPVSLGGTVTIASSGGSGSVVELTGNSGGAVGPDGGGNINVVGDGTVVTVVGNPGTNTLTTSITGVVPVANGGTGASTLTGVLIGHGTSPVTGNAVTQYDVLIGGASNAITSVAPSATSGVPLISKGSATNPAFGTAVVAGGGTGTTGFTAYSVITAGATGTAPLQSVAGLGTSGQLLTSNGAGAFPTWQTSSFTTPVTVPNGGTGDTSIGAYEVVCGGTTSTNPLQTVSGLGTSGYVLTSNGAAALPTWQISPSAALSLQVQVFPTSGTYMPTSGMQYCIIEVLGGGGAGGGVASTSGSQNAVGSGAGSGEYASGLFTAAEIGASQSVAIGAGGTGVSGSNGNAGGTTSVGTLITAFGGAGGLAFAAASTGYNISGSLGGTGGSGGSYRTPGAAGLFGFWGLAVNQFMVSGPGANSQLGAGGISVVGVSAAGNAALGYGAGGSGAANLTSQSARAGGAGTSGIVIVTEYI